MTNKTLITLTALMLGTGLAFAQQVQVSSTWKEAHSGRVLYIPLDGPEAMDPTNMHSPSSTDITIPRDGRYIVHVDFVIGLGYGSGYTDPETGQHYPGYPNHWGSIADRELVLERVSAGGIVREVAKVAVAANVTSMAYLRLGDTWLELTTGDRLRLKFMYKTDESYLGIIVPNFHVRFLEGATVIEEPPTLSDRNGAPLRGFTIHKRFTREGREIK